MCLVLCAVLLVTVDCFHGQSVIDDFVPSSNPVVA